MAINNTNTSTLSSVSGGAGNLLVGTAGWINTNFSAYIGGFDYSSTAAGFGAGVAGFSISFATTAQAAAFLGLANLPAALAFTSFPTTITVTQNNGATATIATAFFVYQTATGNNNEIIHFVGASGFSQPAITPISGSGTQANVSSTITIGGANTGVTNPVTGFNSTNSGMYNTEEGLKLPSGNSSNQPSGAAAEQGMIRNNTSENTGGSVTAIEHFNGTAWKYFAATESSAYPTNLKMYLNSTDTASYSGSGTAWNDLTSNSNNATLANVTQPSSTFLRWNGSSSYAVLPSDPDIGAGTDWSISMWVYQRSSQFDPNYNMIDYNHSLNGGWTIQGGVYYVRNSSGQYISMPVSLTNDAWQHLVISSNGSTATNIYINDTPTAASPSSMPIVTWNAGHRFDLGAWYSSGSYSRNWNGDMTKIQIYNTNLSAAEVNTLFLEGKGF